jgi:RimJ/RimL family protein N-acetyltransferase
MTSMSGSPGDPTAQSSTAPALGLRRRRRGAHSTDSRAPHDFAAAPALFGPTVRLEQLDHAHAPGLSQAAADLGDLWVRAIPSPDGMEAEIDRRLGLQEAGSMAPFTVVDLQSGDPVGMTTFMNIDAPNRRVEIGSTWLSPRAHGGRTNPEMKLMMLTRAFDELDCIAVEFRTHFHNHHSRRAIEKLGAKQDGILRSHTIHRGVLRDTVVYSIIAAEWPTVRFGLEQRLLHG